VRNLFIATLLLLSPLNAGALTRADLKPACQDMRAAALAIAVAEQNIENSQTGGYEPRAIECDPTNTCTVIRRGDAPRAEFDPLHPAASAEGYVSFPGINLNDETSAVLAASRAFERAQEICRH
jgi:hypothetical protein